jgi:OPT oligopeptide transporter protein
LTAGIAPTTDDPNTPALTLRAVIMGLLFGIPLAWVNTIGLVRTTPLYVSSVVSNLLGYPLGVFVAYVLPNWKIGPIALNPGPFTIKEHCLLTIVAGSAGGVAYGIDNVLAQKHENFMVSLHECPCTCWLQTMPITGRRKCQFLEQSYVGRIYSNDWIWSVWSHSPLLGPPNGHVVATSHFTGTLDNEIRS